MFLQSRFLLFALFATLIAYTWTLPLGALVTRNANFEPLLESELDNLLSSLSNKSDPDTLCNVTVERDVYTQLGQHDFIEHKAVKVVIDLAFKEMCQWVNKYKFLELSNQLYELFSINCNVLLESFWRKYIRQLINCHD